MKDAIYSDLMILTCVSLVFLFLDIAISVEPVDTQSYQGLHCLQQIDQCIPCIPLGGLTLC